MAGVGAGIGAGGAWLVHHFLARTTNGCASVGGSVHGTGPSAFVPQCFEPGLAMIGGLVLLLGGAVLFLWGAWAMGRSWSQRERSRGPDILPPLRPTGANPGFFHPASTAAISPPPGWYAVPPDFQPMWWDGRAWAAAPTLQPVRQLPDGS